MSAASSFFWRVLVLVWGLQKLRGCEVAKPLGLFVNGLEQFLQCGFDFGADRSAAGGSFGNFGTKLPNMVVEAAHWHSAVEGSRAVGLLLIAKCHIGCHRGIPYTL